MAVSEVAITYVNIILYALSYQLQRPVEPYLVRSLIRGNGDAAEDESAANRAYGRLTSFFSAIQTVGSPVVGTLLDRIGESLRFCVSLVQTALTSSCELTRRIIETIQGRGGRPSSSSGGPPRATGSCPWPRRPSCCS